MNYRRSRSPLGIKTLRLALFLLMLILLSVEKIHAQPGNVPSVAEMEKQLQPTFKELARQIGSNPLDASLYLKRADIYLALYRRAQYHGSQAASYAEKALADVSKAVESNPSEECYAARARWHTMLWGDAGVPIKEPKEVADFYLKNAHFDIARSDLLNAIRLGKDNEKLSRHFAGLGHLYASRATRLSEAAAELRTRGEGYSIWDDFDLAIEYTKKMAELGPKKAGEWSIYNEEQVAAFYESKGRVAYKLEEYDIALDAFQDGEKYLTNHYLEICNYYTAWGDTCFKKNLLPQAIEIFTKALEASEWNCRNLLTRRGDAYEAMGDMEKALADYTSGLEKGAFAASSGELSIKRAKIYLKLGEADKARADLDYALGRTGLSLCPQAYRLRAEAYRQLGEIELALADEQTASKLPPRDYCFEY